MADTAAHLVDRVLPRVPVRQWVLTLPFGLRFRLAYDAALTTEILRLFIRVVFASLRRRARWLERRGFGQGDQPDEVDPFCQDQPLLASLYGASVRQRVATGPRAGQRVARRGDRIDAEDVAVARGTRCASFAGVNLHANVCVPANDRRSLERLCRYVARPPIAAERLEQLADGRLLYRLKHRWRDGTTHMVFAPMEFMEKLAALVPAPRVNLVRYHGVLAPRSAWRDAVVPAERESGAASAAKCCSADDATPRVDGEPLADDASPSPDLPARLSPSRYYTWPELMRRVFEVDVLKCPDCHGPMRILAVIHPPEATRAILQHIGLPSRAPPIAAAVAVEDSNPDDVHPEYADVFDS
jgi:hypothetical protein